MIILLFLLSVQICTAENEGKTILVTDEQCKVFGRNSVHELNTDLADQSTALANKKREKLFRSLAALFHPDQDFFPHTPDKITVEFIQRKTLAEDHHAKIIVEYIAKRFKDLLKAGKDWKAVKAELCTEVSVINQGLTSGGVNKEEKDAEKSAQINKFLRTMKPAPTSRYVGINFSDALEILLDTSQPLPASKDLYELLERAIEYLGATTIKHQLRNNNLWDESGSRKPHEDTIKTVPYKLNRHTIEAWDDGKKGGIKNNLQRNARNWKNAQRGAIVANVLLLIAEPIHYIKYELPKELRKIRLDFSLSKDEVLQKEKELKSWWNIAIGSLKRKPLLRAALLTLLFFTWRQANYNSILADHASSIVHTGLNPLKDPAYESDYRPKTARLIRN